MKLRERVALMRELGVTHWGSIILGPEPVAPMVHKEPVRRTPEDVQFAATRMRPLPEVLK